MPIEGSNPSFPAYPGNTRCTRPTIVVVVRVKVGLSGAQQQRDTTSAVTTRHESYIGKKAAMISLPYSLIAEVGVLSNKSFMGKFVSTSEIYVRTFGGVFTNGVPGRREGDVRITK